jgi:hypothetical protein
MRRSVRRWLLTPRGKRDHQGANSLAVAHFPFPVDLKSGSIAISS